jgi:hypothetical protein
VRDNCKGLERQIRVGRCQSHVGNASISYNKGAKGRGICDKFRIFYKTEKDFVDVSQMLQGF